MPEEFHVQGSLAELPGARVTRGALTPVQWRMVQEAAEHQRDAANRRGYSVEERQWQAIADEADEAARRKPGGLP